MAYRLALATLAATCVLILLGGLVTNTGAALAVPDWPSTFGYNMVLFLAGLQGIPITLYEAAMIDGANAWQRFWKITLPLLSPAMFLAVILTVISSFQIFDQAFASVERPQLVARGGGAMQPVGHLLIAVGRTG